MLLRLGAELGPSALHNAADHGYLALVLDILSRRPMDVSDRDSSGQTPLHHAAMKGHTDIVQTLLDHGADHEVVDMTDDTALDLAVFYRHDDVIKILGDMSIASLPWSNLTSIAPQRVFAQNACRAPVHPCSVRQAAEIKESFFCTHITSLSPW